MERVKYVVWTVEHYPQIDFKSAELLTELPDPSEKPKTATEMEIELQRE